MIHLKKYSINPSSVAFIDWKAKNRSGKEGVGIAFNFSSGELNRDEIFISDEADIKKLATELHRFDYC